MYINASLSLSICYLYFQLSISALLVLCTIMELLNDFYSEGEQLVRILEMAVPSRESKVTKEDVMRRVIDDVKQMGE